jgi:hypothetical protein
MTTRITIPGTPSDANRQRGRTAQRRGNKAEEWVAGMCRQYEREGTAYIGKLHVPTKGGPRVRTIIGAAPIDFGGVICPSGRGVFAELKSCKSDRETCLAINRRMLEPVQVEALAKRGRGGALCVVLWLRDLTLGVTHWTTAEGFMLAGKDIPAGSFRWLAPLSFDWLPLAAEMDREAKR